jgi:hypothetical protein
MNGKTVAYMVVAVAVGYLLVASLPEQVAMYAAPTSLKSTQEGTLLGGEPESGNLTSPMPSEGEAEILGRAEEDSNIYEVYIGYDLYAWWALDLAVALSVYWLARRRFA